MTKNKTGGRAENRLSIKKDLARNANMMRSPEQMSNAASEGQTMPGFGQSPRLERVVVAGGVGAESVGLAQKRQRKK
jgi:hypothetical protein